MSTYIVESQFSVAKSGILKTKRMTERLKHIICDTKT